MLSSFHSGLHILQEWWKQLFGESEGKQGQGIFPASAVFTTDLHSLGQYLQDGRRSLLETFLVRARGRARPGRAGRSRRRRRRPRLPGRPAPSTTINWKAYEGTRQAHLQGGVPCLALGRGRGHPAAVGALIYMFEKAVAIGGRLLGVNPFDQPGVEAYKKEMFRRLGRPA